MLLFRLVPASCHWRCSSQGENEYIVKTAGWVPVELIIAEQQHSQQEQRPISSSTDASVPTVWARCEHGTHDTPTQCWLNVGPPSVSLTRLWTNIRLVFRVHLAPANTTRWNNAVLMLVQRRRRRPIHGNCVYWEPFCRVLSRTFSYVA